MTANLAETGENKATGKLWLLSAKACLIVHEYFSSITKLCIIGVCCNIFVFCGAILLTVVLLYIRVIV